MGYKLKYDFEFEEGDFDKQDAGEGGLTDALLIVSVIKDAGISILPLSVDPSSETGQLSSIDMFKVWYLLIGHLRDMPDMSDDKKKLFEAVKETIDSVYFKS